MQSGHISFYVFFFCVEVYRPQRLRAEDTKKAKSYE